VKDETPYWYENCMKVAGIIIIVCQEFVDKNPVMNAQHYKFVSLNIIALKIPIYTVGPCH